MLISLIQKLTLRCLVKMLNLQSIPRPASGSPVSKEHASSKKECRRSSFLQNEIKALNPHVAKVVVKEGLRS